jgi:hypothetical protein
MDRVSRKIALQTARQSLARAVKEGRDSPQVIARLEKNVADLEAMKGRWVQY